MYDHDKTSAWMIDFAKTIPVDNGLKLDHRSPWRIGNHEDGYLGGLDNLIMVRALYKTFSDFALKTHCSPHWNLFWGIFFLPEGSIAKTMNFL